ncbi:muconolactone Delta-isomerase [Neisseria leonii]|uniref:muconolactone Delta-isomerase n=1 Tax=Neisseria leonii TaxID=2995413 RepID=UPI00237BE1C5|nr:muconolactone Delta-isomerase [Neisseria sp. 3986]MDD9325042.1 muconolactone Delta-isomerase [Neisseria sp. 3986]
MLFHIRMDVRLPENMPPETAEKIKAEEKAYFQALQQSGKWRHIWRIVGQYSNISIFDAESNEELHRLIGNLPLFPYMRIEVLPLCRHPSSLYADDR